MKIGKYEITQGPNLTWWLVSAVFMYSSIATGNWLIFGGWLAANVVFVPISIWLHNWNEKERKRHDEWKRNEDITSY